MSDGSEMQVLITGCYRTGSTYLTKLLGNVPELATEMHLTNFMRYCYGEYDPIAEEEHYTALVFNSARRIRLRSDRQLDAHAVIDACEQRGEVTYGTLYDAMMRDLVDDGSPCWAEKTQLVWREIPDFLELFDDGRAVLIVRDPRSILASFKEFTYAPEPRYLGAVFNALDAMQHGKRLADDDRFQVVAYEDILRTPEQTVESMLTDLGLSTDHDLLSEDGWTDENGNPWGANSEFDDGSDFDAEAANNRWKTNLHPWEIALTEHVTGEIMDDYGYERSDVSVSEEEYIDTVDSDPQIRQFYETWQETGAGAQQYPTDPTESKNWSENN